MGRIFSAVIPPPIIVKQASVWSKLKALVTGRTDLYHGTSPERAAVIKKEGLLPNVSGGISENVGIDHLNKDLVFTNRTGVLNSGKNQGSMYAGQQRFLEEGVPYKNVANQIAEHPMVPENIRTMARDYANIDNRAIGAHLQQMRPSTTNQGVLRAQMPLSEVAARSVPNPEVQHLKGGVHGLQANLEAAQVVGKIPEPIRRFAGGDEAVHDFLVHQKMNLPFRTNEVLKGGIEPKYFGSRPIKELASETFSHWKDLIKDPKTVLKNVIKHG